MVVLKYAVLNRGDELSRKLMDKVHELAADYPLVLDEHEPDLVLSIGGDGTLLNAIHQYIGRLEKTAFVGVHTGHLGFYADWKPSEIHQLVHLMGTTNPAEQLVSYPMAELMLTTTDEKHSFLALNEFTIKGTEATLVARLDINDETFEMFRGDGIVISTPTGSTGYNKSLGGAIIHPSLASIQIAEIASINNRVYRTLGSSMILPEHHYCDIYPKPNQKISLAVDHLQKIYDNILSLRCKVSNKKVQFVRYRPFPFWNRVHESFINDASD